MFYIYLKRVWIKFRFLICLYIYFIIWFKVVLNVWIVFLIFFFVCVVDKNVFLNWDGGKNIFFFVIFWYIFVNNFKLFLFVCLKLVIGFLFKK